MGRKAEGKIGRRGKRKEEGTEKGEREKGERRKEKAEVESKEKPGTFMLSSSCPSSIYSLQNSHDF